MPIFAASSGIVMPGWPCTNDSASAARVPLPLRRPARRFAGRPAFLRVAFAGAVVEAALRLTEPRGRPGPRRRGAVAVAVVAVAVVEEPPTPCRAEAAASRRLYSSTAGFSSFSRCAISWRFSSRKSVTVTSSSLGKCALNRTFSSREHLTLVLCNDRFLKVSAQTVKCAFCLPLGNPSDQRSADQSADRPERWAKFVAIVKTRAAVGFAQEVLSMRARARRAATLPNGPRAGVALDQLPVNVEADAAQMDPLLHLKAHAWRAVVCTHQLAVNRDPITQALGVHDHLPHVLARGIDLRGDGYQAHSQHTNQRAASGSDSSHSPSACSTAESNECNSTPNSAAAWSAAGSRSPLRLCISGNTSSGSSCAIAAATRAVTPVMLTPSPSDGRLTSIRSAIRSIISP